MTLLTDIQNQLLAKHAQGVKPILVCVPEARRDELEQEMRLTRGLGPLVAAPLHIMGAMLVYEGEEVIIKTAQAI